MESGERPCISSRDEMLSPERAAELLRRQDALQAEAADVLADLRLFDLLATVGEASQVGSAATGLMAWRDIDVEVLCDAWSADAAFRVAQPLASHPRVSALSYRNEAGRFTPPGWRAGYYWGVRYHMDAGDAWKIDVWFWPRGASAEDAAHARELRRALTPETRVAILWIKDALHGQPLYRSVDLYEAVLNHGVRTPAQFESYQRLREREQA